MYSLNLPNENGLQSSREEDVIEQTIIDPLNFEVWYHQQFQTKVVDPHVKRMIDYKKMFNFVCLIEDGRLGNLYDDCGLSNMPLYLNLYDRAEDQEHYINDLYFSKSNSYCIRIGRSKVTWLDLWKAIDDIVKMNGYDEEIVVSHFEVFKANKKGDFEYARAILKQKPDVFEY